MMTTSAPRQDSGTRRPWVAGAAAAVVVVVVVLVVVLSPGGTTSNTGPGGKPVALLTPAPGSSTYDNGQQIGISVAANKYFTPYTRIVVLECADPGGSIDALPKSDLKCDGNTVQGYSILVNKDGSFSTSSYQLFSLPNTQLGENYLGQPVCNRSSTCVLYVGQDQTNFTAPKIFSAPFTILAANVPKKLR